MKIIRDSVFKDLCTSVIASRFIILRMRNVSDKSCREIQNTHFTFGNFFFPRKSVIYEIKWKNMVGPDRL